MKKSVRQSKSFGLSVGTSSILVIFVLLCLTIFATLSMASANADYRLTERAAQSVSAYYTADSAAEERLAGILTELETLRQTAPGAEYPARAARELPKRIPGLEGELSPEGRAFLRYRIPMGDTQELAVCLEVLPAPGEEAVKRLEWMVQNLPEPASMDEGISGLWNGEDTLLPLA